MIRKVKYDDEQQREKKTMGWQILKRHEKGQGTKDLKTSKK